MGLFFKKTENTQTNIITKKDCKVPLYENKDDWCEFSLPNDPIIAHEFMILFKDIANIIIGSSGKGWLQVDISASIMAINGSRELFEKLLPCIKFSINGRIYNANTLDVSNPTYFFACYKAVAEWFKSYEILESFNYYIKPLTKKDVMELYVYIENLMQNKKNLDDAFRGYLEDRVRNGD